MKIIESLEKRRSHYVIGDNLPVSKEKILEVIEKVTELVPDAFNAKSSRVVVLFDNEHKKLWELVFNTFGGQVPREKLDTFKAGGGTILYFYDENVVKGLQEQFPAYAQNFPIWANQSSGMLQLSIWSALRELEIGATLQHYNPVIDENVKKEFDIPNNYVLVAQMPFGNILSDASPKEKEDIKNRVFVRK